MAKWYGVNFPFLRGNTFFGSPSKIAPRQEDFKLVRNDLLQGILTSKGERLFRPQFGGDVYRTLFEQNDNVTRSKLEQNIFRQIQRFHPRITMTRIDTKESQSNPNLINVTIFGNTDLDSTNKEQAILEFQIPRSGN